MYIADLHIHSKYSRATSRDGDAPHLDLWARRKGISLIGTGDFTHPAWREELKAQLVPAEDGLYTLAPELALPAPPGAESLQPRFVVSGEISCIYKKNGRTRKVHHLILLPGLEEAETLARRLEVIGNIHSDGRPILGLDSRDLLEITLESCPEAIFIPAHIWTPHFSLFGAFSGFDSIEECFEDLTPHIHALETGLSSDPPMNWQVSALDPFLLVSNSDAHSPARLGREANLLDGELSYTGLAKALNTGDGFAGTLEFFPEEGKYHLDGHRNCGVCLSPEEAAKMGGICPVCGKKLTIGVLHRVLELADRPSGFVRPNHLPFQSLAPLPEVIAASAGFSVGSVKTSSLFETLLNSLGPEFYILREAPLDEINRIAGPLVAEGIRRMRLGQVSRKGGYDGEYGTISLFAEGERSLLSGQVSLFGMAEAASVPKKSKRPSSSGNISSSQPSSTSISSSPSVPKPQFNQEQWEAISAPEQAVAVIAGPGTGKTMTLVSRIAYLVEERGVRPPQITAVTFTNQAAAEMRQRLEKRLGGAGAVKGLSIGTFHSLCLKFLGEVSVITQYDALDLAAQVIDEQKLSCSAQQLLQRVSQVKSKITCQYLDDFSNAVEDYCQRLKRLGAMDFDDLLLSALQNDFSRRRCFDYLLVDEFQDIDDLQYRLVCQWSREHLFVIGDPDQAIYGFRGARSDCFARLAEDFPDLRTIRLLHNYRSTPQILDCALPVISANPGGNRSLRPSRSAGVPVRLVTAKSDFAESSYIAEEIRRMTGGMDLLETQKAGPHSQTIRAFSDMAVLCRTHRQLERIEKSLRQADIPCVVCGRDDFLMDQEVRGVLGFFRWLFTPGDRASLSVCLKLLWDCPADLIPLAGETALLDVSSLRERFGDGPLALWAARAEEFSSRKKEAPGKLLDRWVGGKPSSPAMERLRGMAAFYRDMPAFLDGLLLGEEGDLRRVSGTAYSSGAVTLSTLHGAKGLEFPVVFLAGLRQGVLPLESSRGPADPQEERRLFFVGITRTREELILLATPPFSSFLEQLPEEVVTSTAPTPHFSPRSQQLSLF